MDKRVFDIWKRKIQLVRLQKKIPKLTFGSCTGLFSVAEKECYSCYLSCVTHIVFFLFPYNILTTWTDAFSKTATVDNFGYFLHSFRFFASDNQIWLSLYHLLKMLHYIQKKREGNAAALWWLDFSYRIPWDPNALFNFSCRK